MAVDFSSVSYKIGKYEFKDFEERQWLKIFYHNCSNGDFFTPSHVMNVNIENKFSILYALNDKMKIDDKYEFLLEYPELKKYNHWRQSQNPTKEKDRKSAGHYYVSGYEKCTIQMEENDWGGLALSDNNRTLIQGSMGTTDWYYAIGQFDKNWGNGRIAGPQAVNAVILWVAITDRSIFFRLLCSSCHRSSYSKCSFIFIYLFVS